jgi:Mn-dependent DtxR family transcriptional regulator
MSAKKILALTIDILEFIMQRRIIWGYELIEKFGYSPESVDKTLRRLKKRGLIINMTRGCWELTEEGYRRLRYYGR